MFAPMRMYRRTLSPDPGLSAPEHEPHGVDKRRVTGEQTPSLAHHRGVALDLFGEVSDSMIVESEKPAYRYRVLVVWLSTGNELLAQVSRELSYPAARKLWGRVLRGDTDVLDATLYNANEPMPLPDGVRLVDALTLPPKLVRVDPDNLFDLVKRSGSEVTSDNEHTDRPVAVETR